jgi:NhaA family Na+:H+ antiporter
MADEQLHATWLHSDRFIPRRFLRPAVRFTRIEAASGIVLVAAAVLALGWANLFPESYGGFWSSIVAFELGPIHFEETLKDFVNDGLMVIFFFVVGLEIKRELVLGELRDPKAAALPALAALGGMILPAVIYLSFNAGSGEAARGWGIPMATDIAFSLGVVALLGRRVPTPAKLFLLALAIADDIGAIVVIAVFYTDDLAVSWLLVSGAAFTGIVLAKRAGIRSLAFYVPLALVAWFTTLESGVHATIAGVALGLLTPARPMYSSEEFELRARQILAISPTNPEGALGRSLVDHEALLLAQVTRESVSPLTRLEHHLLTWSSFLVVPVFALANAGVNFGGVDMGEAITHPVTLGVFLGLVIGKLVGVTSFTGLAVALGVGRLPRGTSWHHVIGLATLAGVGFTVSLFITELAFVSGDLDDFAKIGIFAGSLLAGALGFVILRVGARKAPEPLAERADESAPV